MRKLFQPFKQRKDSLTTKLKQTSIVESKPVPIDIWLLVAVVGLLTIGTIEIYSSSAVFALKKYGDASHFVKRQFFFLILGSLALWLGANTNYRWLKSYTYPLLAFTFLLLGLVLVVGVKINGANRWFNLGLFLFQPVELAKLSLVCYLAYSLAEKQNKMKIFSIGFVPHLLVCGFMVLLILKQPDLGTSFILAATTLLLLFVAGTKISYIFTAVLLAAPVGYMMNIVGSPWRMKRFMAYLNPQAFSQDTAYQIIQSQIAVGSGGLHGAGLGLGRQQLGYMPDGHSDFIIAAIGEEWGFIGIVLVLALFAVIAWRGLRAATKARDLFGSYLAYGISMGFVFQALIHMSVTFGVIPAKGLTLPFVSYGGSSLVVSMYLVGVLLSVSSRRFARKKKRSIINGRFAKRHRPKLVIVRE